MLQEIENMSYADLKAQRADLIAKVESAPVKELATRYVQARTDAAGRDEKLSEQGRTITILQEALEAEKSRAVAAEKRAAEVESLRQASAQQAVKFNAALEALAKELQAEKAEGARFKGLAKSRRQAVAAVVQMLSPLLVDEA